MYSSLVRRQSWCLRVMDMSLRASRRFVSYRGKRIRASLVRERSYKSRMVCWELLGIGNYASGNNGFFWRGSS